MKLNTFLSDQNPSFVNIQPTPLSIYVGLLENSRLQKLTNNLREALLEKTRNFLIYPFPTVSHSFTVYTFKKYRGTQTPLRDHARRILTKLTKSTW